jgi:glycosyltransferase involved in cell wall biosynthesis
VTVRIAIATAQVPFVRGGAELLADELAAALIRAGHEAEIIRVPFKWYPPETLLDHMVACRLLDLSATAGAPIDRVIALKFPAYLIPHPHKVLWLLHQHHAAYERWDHPLENLRQHPLGPQVRAAIQQADSTILADVARRFAISATVAQRLARFCGLEAAVLYPPPPAADRLFCADAADYLFFPSRLAPIKRQSLVLEALAQTRAPVRVAFAGAADLPAYGGELRAQAVARGVSGRVEWLELISEEDKRQRYAHALGVVFPPIDEDYGFVALEGMAAGKPVVTCQDSGGPTELITHEHTGLVVEPTPTALAAAMDRLWQDRGRARAWGAAARARYQALDVGWPSVVRRLLA